MFHEPTVLSSFSWQNWTLNQWSQALFRHFFEYDDEDTPVTRLVITDATWAAVTGDASAAPDQIQQAFLDQFPRTRRDLDYHLSKNACGLPLHDFFPYLILSCMVAAASEETTKSGQFRQRHKEMLKTRDFSQLPLTGFGEVWEEFSRQLERGRNQNNAWRRLKLPTDYGQEKLIGYSKRLAFPSRNDQQQLAECLTTLDRNSWLDEPPIYAVLIGVERRIGRFSAAFQEEFQDFKKLVLLGQETVAHPFWAAVRGVLRVGLQERRSGTSRQMLDLLLLMEFDEFDEPVLSLLSKTTPPWSSIVSQFLDEPIAGGYDRLLVADENPGEPACRLLKGVLSRSDIRSTLLEVVQDGLLIFQKVEGYQVARTRPPEPGPAVVLVREDRKHAFVGKLDSLASNRSLKPYPDTRWYWLDNLDGQQIPPLPGIRCLAQVARSASIGVHDGIRCPGGSYLSRFAALPEFRFAGKRLWVDRLPTTAGHIKTPILNQTETGWRFADGHETRNGIEGEFEIVAESWAGKRISARRIRFQREVLSWDYGSPSDPTAWEIEAGQQDTATLAMDDRLLWDIGAAWNPEQCLNNTASLPASEPDSGWRYTGVGDLIEALAAIGTTRTLGLAEMEFLDFLRRFLDIGEKDYRLIWDVARAWTEAGLVQRISDRRWRSVRYLPQVPRLCVSRAADGAWRGVVLGLIPAAPGSRLANTAKNCEIEARWVASVSPWLPPGLVLTAATAEALHSFANQHGLEIVAVRSLNDLLASLDQALRHDDPPGGYSLYALWNWEQGRFQKLTGAESAAENPGVFWYRRERGDQRDYFLARARGGQMRWSYSRVWSLLAGARLLGEETYVHHPKQGFLRRVLGGVHLPLLVGRLTFGLSGCASGPVKGADGNITYRYPLCDDIQVKLIGTQLLGWVFRKKERGHIPDWLRTLMIARLPVEPGLPVSGGLGKSIFIPVSLEPIYQNYLDLTSKKK